MRSVPLRSGIAPALFLILALLSTAAAPAAEKDKKEEKKPEPPRITVSLPMVLIAGATNKVVIRGQHLTNVTTLRFTNGAFQPAITLRSKGKADVPKDADVKKLGDTQIEVELVVPADAPAGTHHFTVTSPIGTSEPMPLLIRPAAVLVREKEPNGGYQQAQPVRLGQTVSGAIKEAADVDVFRFTGRRGQRVDIEVWATPGGSALDSLVTLLDAAGHLLATNDDRGTSRDSILRATLPADGDYLVSLIDARDQGGPAHVYVLSLHEAP